MQFYDVLASIIHDMKNSLGMVVHTLDDVTADPDFKYDKIERITALKNEAKRLNNNLIELLTLYKIDNERISPVIDEINIFEFYSEIMAENMASARANGIELICQCDEDLHGYFDEGLIRGVIDNLIGNGMRYSKDKLLLSAEEKDGYLVLRVDDNGRGYPEEMLEAQEAGDIHNRISEGRTQLGLYFASLVAQMHENQGNKGKIKLDNHGHLDGGSFSIWLP